jgi:uncharacterized LabA/DUF88 family protein
MRQMQRQSDDTARVRVFVDHWEFSNSWLIAYSGFTGSKLTGDELKTAQMKSKEINWPLLPDAVIEHLDEIEYIGNSEKELRNIDVYASMRRTGDQKADNDFKDWLEHTLDHYAGFEVHHFNRNDHASLIQCRGCGAPLESPELEKGLKTAMACDLLSYAVKDLYDIAVLFADDAELAPSILSVQEIFDKKVIHVGLPNRGQSLRSAAWGHFLLNDLMKDLIKPDDFKRKKNRSGK